MIPGQDACDAVCTIEFVASKLQGDICYTSYALSSTAIKLDPKWEKEKEKNF